MPDDEQDGGVRRLFVSRIGTFFVLLGIGLLLLFIASDVGPITHFPYFFIGIALLGFGVYLKRSASIPRGPSTRFEGLRRMRQKSRENKEKRSKK